MENVESRRITDSPAVAEPSEGHEREGACRSSSDRSSHHKPCSGDGYISDLTKPATAAAGPAKKDGTPDMRYKANKDAAAAKPATTHMKKDGTPDKRYKENKAATAPKKS